MRDLPRATAAAIYRTLYWTRPRFDAVAERAPKVAAALFDTGINMGTGMAAGFLQRVLNAPHREARAYPDVALDRATRPRTPAALDGFLHAGGPAGARPA